VRQIWQSGRPHKKANKGKGRTIIKRPGVVKNKKRNFTEGDKRERKKKNICRGDLIIPPNGGRNRGHLAEEYSDWNFQLESEDQDNRGREKNNPKNKTQPLTVGSGLGG